MYLGIFELGISIHTGQTTLFKLTVTEVEPLDGCGCISRRGAGGSGETFFCLCRKIINLHKSYRIEVNHQSLKCREVSKGIPTAVCFV